VANALKPRKDIFGDNIQFGGAFLLNWYYLQGYHQQLQAAPHGSIES
jgi:hypothetical protein